MTLKHYLHYPDRLYIALLALYPRRFKVRFAAEMSQVFRDCCRLHGCRGTAPLIWFCLQTARDLLWSIPAEWRREITRIDSSIDYPGLADSIMVSIVVGTNLLGWGWTGAAVALDVAGRWDMYSVPLSRPGGATFALMAFTLALAILIGALSAVVVSRWRSNPYPRLRIQ